MFPLLVEPDVPVFVLPQLLTEKFRLWLTPLIVAVLTQVPTSPDCQELPVALQRPVESKTKVGVLVCPLWLENQFMLWLAQEEGATMV